jgi:hypothetical protein
MSINYSDLKKPFAPSETEWRLVECGKGTSGIWAKCVAYVSNRAIMDRLDDVCGAGNWWNEFKAGPGGGVICGLSIRDVDHVVCKWDGADNTDIEGVKGGLSNSMKRAAVQWGIGRFLYDLEIQWAVIDEKGRYFAKLPDKHGGGTFKWNAPALPTWAVANPTQPPPAEPKKRGNGKAAKPGDEVSTCAAAVASVRNAPTVAVLEKYSKATSGARRK